MSIKINVLGIETTKQFLNSKERKIDNKLIPQGLKNASIFLQGEIKASIAGRKAEPTSVDTSRFLNSVDFQLINKNNAIVFTKVPYAKKLEFGFGNFKARRHFNNSKDRSKFKIKSILNAKIKSI